MSQSSNATAPRSWAVRLLLVLMLALCVLLLHAPHGAAPPGAPAAMAPAGPAASGSTSAQAGHQAVSDRGASGAETATETAISFPVAATAHSQASEQRDDHCSCCPTPLNIAVTCATVNTGPPQHGTLLPTQAEDAFSRSGLASSGDAAQRAAPPPALAELSLLRI